MSQMIGNLRTLNLNLKICLMFQVKKGNHNNEIEVKINFKKNLVMRMILFRNLVDQQEIRYQRGLRGNLRKRKRNIKKEKKLPLRICLVMNWY